MELKRIVDLTQYADTPEVPKSRFCDGALNPGGSWIVAFVRIFTRSENAALPCG
jgi:hypothetical protein